MSCIAHIWQVIAQGPKNFCLHMSLHGPFMSLHSSSHDCSESFASSAHDCAASVHGPIAPHPTPPLLEELEAIALLTTEVTAPTEEVDAPLDAMEALDALAEAAPPLEAAPPTEAWLATDDAVDEVAAPPAPPAPPLEASGAMSTLGNPHALTKKKRPKNGRRIRTSRAP